jgi:cytosine/adenosine deaminase-related metal-dependent hydrolase
LLMTPPHNHPNAIVIRGAVCALGPEEARCTSLRVVPSRTSIRLVEPAPSIHIDLSGYLVMPGLINAHDHLHFALYPRLGNPPYRNYIHWGEDIHATLSQLIATYKTVPKDLRLWWGLIRNLLCGVTTVCHHDELSPLLWQNDLPITVLQRFGWAHSPALGGDLRQAHATTPHDSAFIVHACEGVDDLARKELRELHHLRVLDAGTVIVHGLAMNEADVRLMNEQRSSLILCPSSNEFLFERLPHFSTLCAVEKVALGSDSSITAIGDLLDEVRFAIERSGITPDRAYRMVTESAATVLRLKEGEGTLCTSGTPDLIAIRDTGEIPAARLPTLSMHAIELVITHGSVQLASESMRQRLPSELTQNMEQLWVDGEIRWLRAPVQMLLQQAEAVLGSGNVQLGHRPVRSPHRSTAVVTTTSHQRSAYSTGGKA